MKDYLPARLVKGKTRWYICYYQTNPSTGKRELHRETFQMGRVRKQDRLKVAKQQIESINAQLPFGYPFSEDFYIRTVATTAEQAFKIVEEAGSDLRHATKLSYAYSIRKFSSYLNQIQLLHQPVESITKKVAMGFSDFLVKQGLSGRSHNNDINEMKRLFNVLKTREIVEYNPFEGIPKRKVEKKSRKPIDQKSAMIIMHYLRQSDKSVYLSCALLYYCFIRPNEQRYLQSKDIDLDANLINISGKYSKNRKDACVTIPEQLREILISLQVDNLAPTLYILGSATSIGKRTPVGKSSISNRYRDLIQEMHAQNILEDITGNTLYSWKDTGATRLAKSGINAIQLRDQLRHHSVEEMQAYIEDSKGSNEFIRIHHRL